MRCKNKDCKSSMGRTRFRGYCSKCHRRLQRSLLRWFHR